MAQQRPIRALMIGAHPDDCDFECGGLALQYVAAGHSVQFISLADGSGGHQSMDRPALAARRRGETQAVSRLTGIPYEVWDIPDCQIVADLPARQRVIRAIRGFNPDVVFCCRPNDYHADHRNTSLLVQDASYMLIVPNECPDAPPMKTMPVIMHVFDRFQNPPFSPSVVIDIDGVQEKKMQMLSCHESQVYEWLPFTEGTLDHVPADARDRYAWLHEPRIPREGAPLSVEQLLREGRHSYEYRDALPASLYRDHLIARYGKRGETTRFAEAFAASEYGAPLTEEAKARLFPF